jgi:hypothetical protein
MVRISEPGETVTYGGFSISPQWNKDVAEDGSARYACTLTATATAQENAEVAPGSVVFARTVVLTAGQAALRNAMQPGTIPPENEIDARLVEVGMRYVQGLINAVNRGFHTPAPTRTLSVAEAGSRIGMSDNALRTREQ